MRYLKYKFMQWASHLFLGPQWVLTQLDKHWACKVVSCAYKSFMNSLDSQIPVEC